MPGQESKSWQLVNQQGFDRASANRLIREVVMPAIAKELGLDSLPLDKENYDFFSRGASILQAMSPFEAQELEHATYKVIHNLAFPIPRLPKGQEHYRPDQRRNPATEEGEKIGRGPIYNYKAALIKKGKLDTPEKYPFNRFFVNLFRKRAQNVVDEYYKKGWTRDIKKFSLTPGGEYDEVQTGGTISEGVVEDPDSPRPDAVAERNEERKRNREILDKLIPQQIDLLDKERDPKILKVYYQMFILGGAKLWEVGEKLDQLSETDSDYYPPGGGVDKDGNKVPWAENTLSKYKDTIIKIMQQYFQEQARKTHPEALSPEQSKAIFQSRRRA